MQMGVGGSNFLEKRYKGLRFNIISVMRGWVRVQFPPKKKHYVTLEWPLRCSHLYLQLMLVRYCRSVRNVESHTRSPARIRTQTSRHASCADYSSSRNETRKPPGRPTCPTTGNRWRNLYIVDSTRSSTLRTCHIPSSLSFLSCAVELF